MKNIISQNVKNFFSKEFFLLLNNVIMIASTFTVLLGTIYPIVMDIFGLSKISIGPPYYEKLLAPIFLPMFFLMAFSILINWKKNTLQITVKQISKIIVVSFIFCLFLNLLTKFEFDFVLSVMLFLILLPIISVFSVILKPNNLKKVKFNFLINKSGMYFSHIGVAIFSFGVLYVNSFDIESDSKISIGERINVGSYIIKLESTRNIKGPNFDGIQGIFKVNDINGRDLGFLYPEKRFYVTQKTTMTESSVKKIWFDDLYLSLGEQLDSETWIIRAYYKPFIMFLWIGVILIGLGGIFSLLQYYSFNSSNMYVKKN
jgi:cytochrome c-type biogenesis protein CcmF